MTTATPTITNRVNGMKMRGRQAKQAIAIGDCDVPTDINSVNVIVIGDLAAQPDYITDSVFIGPQTARQVKTGNGNVAVGNLTLNSIVETYHNTCVGDATGRYLETGSAGNVFMGYIAGEHFTAASNNVVIGSFAGAYSTTGTSNILIGDYAGAHSELVETTIGDHNIAIGSTSQIYGEGDHNISMGEESLHSVKGSYNIGIGRKTGLTLDNVAATNNIFIGQNSGWATGVQKADAVNSIAIGANTYTTASNQVVIGDSNITATILQGAVSAGTSLKTGNAAYTPASYSGLTVFDTSAGGLSVGTNGNYCSIVVEKANASAQMKYWNMHYRGDTAASNDYGAWVLIGQHSDNSYRVPIICNQNSDIILAGSSLGGSSGKVGIGEPVPDYKLDVNGTFGFTPGASVTPIDNGDVVFELTGNTTLTVKAKGSDGTVRTIALTLA